MSSKKYWQIQNIENLCTCILSCFSCVQLFATLWTIAHQSFSMGFSRWEYWGGLPYLPQGIKPTSPVSSTLQTDTLLLSHQEIHRKYECIKVWVHKSTNECIKYSSCYVHFLTPTMIFFCVLCRIGHAVNLIQLLN